LNSDLEHILKGSLTHFGGNFFESLATIKELSSCSISDEMLKYFREVAYNSMRLEILKQSKLTISSEL
jgi:hypothetical protein